MLHTWFSHARLYCRELRCLYFLQLLQCNVVFPFWMLYVRAVLTAIVKGYPLLFWGSFVLEWLCKLILIDFSSLLVHLVL